MHVIILCRFYCNHIENVFNIMAAAYIKSDNSKINVKSYANSNSVSAVTYFISYNNKEKHPFISFEVAKEKSQCFIKITRRS